MKSRRGLAKLMGALIPVVLSLNPGVARAEFPSLERSIQLAREKALTVVDAQAELGVAQAQLAGARVSFLGNPYTEVQVDRGTVNPVVQALAYTYFPMDIGGQRGARIEEA